jgi:hypothetical protein
MRACVLITLTLESEVCSVTLEAHKDNSENIKIKANSEIMVKLMRLMKYSALNILEIINSVKPASTSKSESDSCAFCVCATCVSARVRLRVPRACVINVLTNPLST